MEKFVGKFFLLFSGIQIRKLYESQLFPESSTLPIFEKYFGPQRSRWGYVIEVGHLKTTNDWLLSAMYASSPRNSEYIQYTK